MNKADITDLISRRNSKGVVEDKAALRKRIAAEQEAFLKKGKEGKVIQPGWATNILGAPWSTSKKVDGQ